MQGLKGTCGIASLAKGSLHMKKLGVDHFEAIKMSTGKNGNSFVRGGTPLANTVISIVFYSVILVNIFNHVIVLQNI